jgi:putative peptidoglycan lipid II flippase
MNVFLRWLPTGSIILSITTFSSYGVGLLRDRVLAQTFGAGRELDAYTAAFLLPDFLFNFLIAAGIAAAVVPIVTDLLAVHKKHVLEYLNSVIVAGIGVMGIVAVLLIIFAGTISTLVVPGFVPEDQALVADLLRILALSPLFFSISNALGAYLIVKRRYLFYGLSPIFYNFGIIFGALFLTPYFGIAGVAYGTLLGALLHLGTRLLDAFKNDFRFQTSLAFRTSEFKTTIRLMIPKMFGHPVEMATFWGFTIFASALTPGSVAIMSFARNFQSVPVSLIGITLATTTFPLLASALTNKNYLEFSHTLKKSFWLILGGSLAAALFIFLIREPLIALVFGGGAFTEANIKTTALTLGFFTLSIPTESLSHLLVRAFYATKNTLTPVLIGLASFGVTIGCAWTLTPALGIIALPLAFFCGSFVKLFLLLLVFPSFLKKLQSAKKTL